MLRDGFRTMVTIGSDDCIRSGMCAVGRYEWEICVYPAWTAGSPDGDKWVALRLVLLSKPNTPAVRANLRCQAVNPNLWYETPVKKQPGVFGRPKNSTPFVYLVSVSDVQNKGYLAADALTVECTITVLKESPAPTSPAKEMPVPSSNLHKNLGDLPQTEMGADVTFLVSDESFAAHKNILAARSPVFKAQFFGEMKEKVSQDVVVDGMEAAGFKAMLHFIYTDTVPELEQGLEAVMAQHLLVAADRYGLDKLKMFCENKLSSGITVDTAATTLALAEQHNCLRLKASCVEFIVSTPEVIDAVLETEGYMDLAASCFFVWVGCKLFFCAGRSSQVYAWEK
ncbi:hypothetical protein CFC21_111086 [Triticum aestivum]|uniref:BTB domain-containing protein n=2 Tax=Triticum aestivum TaxID=4565 RepID=A0A3B6TXJ2_WHEAT|nr:BTB/POZ and MATH domain-containing protein 1-like [Triticum aestivum]KAF7111036.1 hypothetical protein CFC21_111086 [Triticum aestivum]